MDAAKYTWAGVAAFAVLFVGCQHAAMTYSLHREGLNTLLFPPTKDTDTSESSRSSIAVRHARQKVPQVVGCDVVTDFVSVHWLGTTANVSLQTQEFVTAAGDQGIYVDPVQAIEKFRVELTDRQSKGCLRAKESERLLRTIVESFPLPPAIAYFFQLGSYDITGYFDLTSDFRMQVTNPIYRSNTAPSPESLIGYETANYAFFADGADERVRIRLTSATEALIGAAPIEKRSLRNELPFSKSPGYFRLLFMADETSSSRITRAILLSTRDEAKLAQAVVHRQVSADDFCSTLSIADVTCTIFPKNFGISPELRISVNRKDTFVPVGGMVQEALALNNDDGPPRGLRISRPYRGRLIPITFDASSADILKLVLLPRDQITF